MAYVKASTQVTNGQLMFANMVKAIIASTVVGLISSLVLASAVLLLNV